MVPIRLSARAARPALAAASLALALSLPVAGMAGVTLAARAEADRRPTRAAPPETMRVAQSVKEPKPKEKRKAGTVEEMIREAFGKRASEALRIAHCESRFDPSARSSAGARGIFQLMPVHRWRIAEVSEHGKDFTDPRTNIRVARDLFEDEGWQPWVCARKLGIRA